MRNSSWLVALVLTLILLPGLIANAGTISSELQSVLDSAVPAQKVDVIVILKDRVNFSTFTDPDIKARRETILTALKDKANRTQTPVLDFLLARNSEKVVSLWLINGIGVTVRAAVVPLLARLPAVEEVRLNFAIPLAEPVPAPAGAAPIEWNLDAIRTPDLWALGHTGQGIVIANMDTGVDYRHLDLAGRYRDGPSPSSWYDPNGQHTTVPVDVHGHGTQTMGIMLGGEATLSAIGVAPGAQWIAAKIFNDAGIAPLTSIHLGFQWLLDPNGDGNPDDAPDVVNNSWGFTDMVDVCYLEFQTDIQALRAAGIAVVFAAGNQGATGAATSISPANNPESFAVGSVAFNQVLAFDSSQGPSPCVVENDFFPEVVAPGVNIKTSDLTGGIDLDAMTYGFGTSFAAPHVTGALALLRGAFPNANLSELEAALKDTAQD
ncbi:MAG: S8 family serine peptidase, partial [Gemmatimonadota bacterium]